ncbi:MAG: (Fe-S)-binding protein [Deltaproteobacteria bacterium]|nr:(Fe-S)-binding protein [Deltaproteobacteria bacterium]RLB39326.1 MAG: hypothetical protein DRH20_03845 [Deltaproteobacteria bacterium]
MRHLEDYEDAISRCFHCQICQAACPVYLQDLLETYCARARLGLVQAVFLEQTLKVTPRLREVMDRCLFCTRCTRHCPAGVPLDDVFALARENLGKQLGEQGRDGGAWTAPDAGVPGPVAGPLKSGLGEIPAVKGPVRARVAYYPGCATSRLFQDTGQAVLRVMSENGVQVMIPEGLSCCGFPAYVAGDLHTFRRAMQENLSILSGLDVDAILVDCASCGMAFKVKAGEVAKGDGAMEDQAARVAEKTWEATDYLNHLGPVAEPGAVAGVWTYHAPCRIGWTPTAEEAPEALLQHIPGAQYEALETTGACCGAGDLFHLRHGELSRSIRTKRLKEIRRNGAHTVVTQCPFCRYYLQQGGSDLEVMHPLAFLARAYGEMREA